ncbi:MAG: acyl-[acyl-carrier-protein]-phospholipid O-acyltransferase, partial [Planctomycetota bacterium]
MFRLLKERSFGALTLTQFLGAFNDNAFKQLVLMLALTTQSLDPLEWVASSRLAEYGQALPATLFSLPFVMFGAVTGSLADRLSKTSIIRFSNLMEVIVMALGLGAFMLYSYDLLMVVIFLMGTQSAIFGPAKYGSIVEIVGRPALSRANAMVQMTTMLAILGGAMLGGVLFDSFGAALWTCGGIYVGTAFAGWLASLLIDKLPAKDPQRRIRMNVFAEMRDHWHATGGNRPLILSIFASSFFYLIGASLLLVVNAYGVSLGLDGSSTAMLNAMTVIGIALGSVLAGHISRDRIEAGLIPLGLAGMACFLFLVQLAPDSIPLLRASLLGLGLSAGLFSIPIRALIQSLPPEDRRGAVLGFSEVLDFAGILVASALFYWMDVSLELAPSQMFLVLGVLVCVFLAGSLVYTIEFAVRLFLLTFTHVLYSIRVSGSDRIPNEGGALIVANHVSFVDAMLLSAACSRRIRFLVHRPFFDSRFIGGFLKRIGALPVGGADRDETRDSLEKASRAAQEGELVCIFAEGSITRTGTLLPFARGLERIARKARVPILPIALDRVWGSVFSFEGGRVFWKLPQRIPYPVDLFVGHPLDCETPAWTVREHISELVAEGRSRRRGRRGTLAWRFLWNARRNAARPAIVDGSGTQLSYRKLLIGSLALRRYAATQLDKTQHVGVMLPPGVGGALANVALTLMGRTLVNVNYTSSPADQTRCLEIAGVRQVITSKRFLRALGASSPLAPDQTIYIEDWLAGLRGSDRFVAFLQSLLPAGLLAHWVARRLRADEVAMVVFSSGSTGDPKGVQLTHAAVLSNVQAFGQVVPFGPQDGILGVLPLFHSFGTTVTLWSSLLSGAKAIYYSNPLDAKAIGQMAREHGATILVATPTMYQFYLRRCEPVDFATLRISACGAEKLRQPLSDAWEKRFGQPLLEGYGATELGPVVSFNLPDVRLRGEQHVARRVGSVGRALPGVALRVVHPDTGVRLEPGHDGLLLVKSPAMMTGYLGQAELTGSVIRDGWYVTGDIARVDRDGFLILTDRLSRFSKIGGEMVPHGRVEEVLIEITARHTTEGDELPQLSITSIADEKKGERLIVIHTPLPLGVAELLRLASESDLP